MRRGAPTLAALAAAALAAAGCVVVEEEPVRPRGAPAGGGGAAIEGPIATPALGARTVNSRVVASIEPLGTVPYDGQVLPLVSPDGRFVATQVGEAPPWDTLLAGPGQHTPARLWIEVYDITEAPPRLIETARDMPRGLLLGRSCDERGFLVESVRPNGARWIGRVGWLSSRVDWLVRGDEVNAFAAPTADGGLAYAHREIDDEDGWALVTTDAPADRRPGAVMPMAGPRGDLYALRLIDRGLELVCWDARPGGGGSTSYVRARRVIAPGGGMGAAYQAMAPRRGASHPDLEEAPGFLLYDPSARRMSVFDAETGALTPLAEGSIAGAWARDGGGVWAVILTTPRGLMHQRLERRGGVWEAMPASKVLFDPFVPRATASADRPFVLFGPDERDGRRLAVMGLSLGGE